MPRRSGGRFGRTLCITLVLLAGSLLPVRAAQADTVRGQVLDPLNQPVAAATVLILRGQAIVASAQTNGEGRFGPIAVAAGTYDLSVAAPGLRLGPTSVSVATHADVDVTLRLAITARPEAVLVSASPIDTAASRTADSVTVLDAAQLARTQVDTVGEALRQVPGFNVTASGGRGAVTSLFPRGGESDYTLVLVDGIPQNVFGGSFDAAHLTTVDADRIEVVRGPQSALYGSGAIGGLVHLVTASGGDLRGTAKLEAGSYGTQGGSASVAGSHRTWSFGGGSDWLSTDGDTRTFPGAHGPVSNDDYTRRSANGSLSWADGSMRRVRVDAQIAHNDRGEPGPFGSDPLGLYGGIDKVSRAVNNTHAIGMNGLFGSQRQGTHRLQLTWMGAKGDYASPYGPSSDESHRLSGRYQYDIASRTAGLSAGAEFMRERADNTFITNATSSQVPVLQSDVGLFAEVRPNLGSRVFVNLGMRLERIERQPLVTDGFSRPAFDASAVWSANPKLAMAWIARQGESGSWLGWTKIRGDAGTGIKPPTAFEIAFTDNPALKPERSRSVDLGVEQSFVQSRLIVDATWFRNRYSDLIVAVGKSLTGASRYRTDNVANAEAHGVELGATWRVTSTVSVRADLNWLHTEVLAVDNVPSGAPPPYTLGAPLIRRPRLAGSAQVTWALSRVAAFLSVSGHGKTLDFEPNFASAAFDNPGFTTTTIGASVHVARTVEVYGRVANAFNRAYEEVLGYPALGRTASVGIRVTPGH